MNPSRAPIGATQGSARRTAPCAFLRLKIPSLRFLIAPCLAAVIASATTVTATPPTSRRIIEHLKMAKIPDEGAWFAVTYESADRIPAGGLPPRYGSSRLAGTSIYALVTHADFSALHRLRTDEVWHFHAGDPIELVLLHPDGRSEIVILGADVLAGQRPQFPVLAGTWMGARPLSAAPEAYSLFGCTLAPGFDYTDYESGYRDELQAAYPDRATLIAELTRAEFLSRPPGQPAPATKAAQEPTPTVFSPDSIPTFSMAPGVELRELIGRTAAAKTSDYSIARFTLAPGKGTGTSYNKVGEEVFLIISGRGTVVLGKDATAVSAGSVVVMKPGVHHSLTASTEATEPLEFYAITFPAFSPQDYVRIE